MATYILRSGVTADGKGHFVDVTLTTPCGSAYVGRTRTMRTHPAAARATTAAENMARRNAGDAPVEFIRCT